ncbi:nudix domain-containing protein [Xylariaceae sp. FL1019]|nr:nudix domain-containing protein [Xylariaceae sp. FL1019]
MSTQQPAATLPAATEANRPKVGVTTIVPRRNADNAVELLLGKRLKSHGTGKWACPGGHIEYGESFYECGRRELLEETGLVAKDTTEPDKFAAATNDVFGADGKHYITIFIVCELEDANAKPEAKEPDKCASWEWVPWEEVKSWNEKSEKQAFLPLINLAKNYPDFDFGI